jgi:hypothetical protein
MKIKEFNYSANFCEENIWHLCQNQELKDFTKKVLIISNPLKNCPFRFQKSINDDEVVWWNYHVIMLASTAEINLVYDFDSTLSLPISAKEYFELTFEKKDHLKEGDLPFFKSINAMDYIDSFFSDRSHMKDADGNWLSSPPDWHIIGKNKNLPLIKLQDFSISSEQKIYSLEEMEALI